MHQKKAFKTLANDDHLNTSDDEDGVPHGVPDSESTSDKESD